MSSVNEILEQLHQAKLDSGLSYLELEIESDVGMATLKRWFGSRKMPPRLPNLVAVADVLGYEVKLVKKEQEK